jgi:cell division transport system permease protein
VSGAAGKAATAVRRGRRQGPLAPRAGAPNLVALVSAAMCFLAVCALEAGVGAARISGAWSAGLTGAATVRVPAPEGRAAALPLADAALAAARALPGVEAARVVPEDEAAALLAPWLGAEAAAGLPAPVLIDVKLGAPAPDAAEAARRVAAAAPGAVWDDHAAWRAPLEASATAFRRLAWWSVGLMGAAVAAMVVAASRASLFGAASTVRTLRLLGARDGFIAATFDRPLALRAFLGGAVGAPAGWLAVAALPALGLPAALGAPEAARPLPDLIPALAAPFACAAAAWMTARLSVLSLIRSEL